MDSNRFDRLSRHVGSRRSVGLAMGAAMLLGLAEAATAKKKKRRCKKIRKGARCDGTTCDGFSVSTCHSRKFGRCRCREGTTCLPNKSCGLSCTPECPDGCLCAVGGEQVCLDTAFLCEEVSSCASTADCPFGTACTETRCDGPGVAGKRCVPHCNSIT
jgi:hypothetical protein